MNVDTGEIRRYSDDLAKLKKEGFIPVPDDLAEQAETALGKKESVVVDESHALRKEMIKRFGRGSKKKREKRLKK